MKLLPELDPSPITRITWISQETRKEWEPRIKKIVDMTYQIEIESVAKGHRKLTTVNVTPQNFESDFKSFSEKGLSFVPIKRVKKYTGFSHYHDDADSTDPNSYVFGVVCKDIKDGQAFYDYHENTPRINHHAIGELLGYPICCRNFFHYWFSESGIPDLPWHQGLNDPAIGEHSPTYRFVSGSGYLNEMLRYWGIRLAPHLPCSHNCEASIKWVEDVWWPLALSIDKDAALDLLFLLEMPIRFDVSKGIAIIDTPLFRGFTNSVHCSEKHVLDFLPINNKVFTIEKIAPWTKPGLTYPFTLFKEKTK